MGVGAAGLSTLKEMEKSGALRIRVYAAVDGSAEDLGDLLGVWNFATVVLRHVRHSHSRIGWSDHRMRQAHVSDVNWARLGKGWNGGPIS